jgi:hypothetical protein
LMLARRSPSYYYSLANKFFDYVQAGLPQLVSPFPEYVALNALHEVGLMTELEPDAIAENLLALWNERELYDRLQTNARAAAAVWHWGEEEVTLRHIYRTAIGPATT